MGWLAASAMLSNRPKFRHIAVPFVGWRRRFSERFSEAAGGRASWPLSSTYGI
jgi:hypothetical protein